MDGYTKKGGLNAALRAGAQERVHPARTSAAVSEDASEQRIRRGGERGKPHRSAVSLHPFPETTKRAETYFWNSHSRLSRGHTWRVLSQREMQWKWNACCVGSGGACDMGEARSIRSPRRQSCARSIHALLTLQMPHATVHSSDVADAWFAWHSMPACTHDVPRCAAWSATRPETSMARATAALGRGRRIRTPTPKLASLPMRSRPRLYTGVCLCSRFRACPPFSSPTSTSSPSPSRSYRGP